MARLISFSVQALAIGILGILTPDVSAEGSCIYLNSQGQPVAIPSRQFAPLEFRKRVVCREKKVVEIAAPLDLELGADARVASFSTDVGPMKIQWPRSVEKCFNRAPSRAVGEAAQAFSKALRAGRFSAEVKYARREWSLAFIDKARAFSQFPLALSLGGHPGFMIPPAQIYIITDFVAPDCTRKSVADETLTQVLLHEMGHVLEFLLLGEREVIFDRARAEGFASWFEQYSADFANSVTADHIRQEYAALAKSTLPLVGRGFSGTQGDYAQAALPFQAIVARKGIAGLMRVYKVMRDDKVAFYEAVKRGVAWDRSTLDRQVQEQLEVK